MCESDTKKRIVFYLGAGAAIPWDGPGTYDINKLIKRDNIFTTKDENPINIGEKVFSLLSNHFDHKTDINFETFISFLENVFDYVISDTNKGTHPNHSSLLPLILSLKKDLIENISDYSIQSTSGSGQKAYKIPRNTTDSATLLDDIKTIDRVYFSKLLEHYLHIILDEIFYSERITDPKHVDLNTSLKEMVKDLYANDYILRFYTTNYDRLLPTILKGDYKVFDGFTDEWNSEYGISFLPDHSKIYNDLDCINYYNLHGSLYWELEYIPSDSYRFVCKPNNPNSYINLTTTEITNPGHAVFPTKIITGYNKLQRTSIEPFNHFNNIFYYDCAKADLIVTVGTSFSDMHINRSISNAVNNLNANLLDIDCEKDYKTRKFDKHEQLIFGKDIFPNDFTSNTVISNNRKYKIYNDGFGKFIKDRIWKELILKA